MYETDFQFQAYYTVLEEERCQSLHGKEAKQQGVDSPEVR